LEHPVYRGVSF